MISEEAGIFDLLDPGNPAGSPDECWELRGANSGGPEPVTADDLVSRTEMIGGEPVGGVALQSLTSA